MQSQTFPPSQSFPISIPRRHRQSSPVVTPKLYNLSKQLFIGISFQQNRHRLANPPLRATRHHLGASNLVGRSSRYHLSCESWRAKFARSPVLSVVDIIWTTSTFCWAPATVTIKAPSTIILYSTGFRTLKISRVRLRRGGVCAC